MGLGPKTLADLPRWQERLPADQLWRSNDLSEASWTSGVPEAVCAQIRELARTVPESLVDPARAPLPDPLSAIGRWSQDLRRHHLDGPGLVRILAPAGPRLDGEQARLLFAQLGRALGEPLLRYGLLYEVKDRGDSYLEKAIPVSQTASATGLHTDSSALDCEPEFVGLLCERPSLDGGESVVSNGIAAHEWLREHAPGSLLRLYAPMVRDLVTPGVHKTPANRLRNRFPVFRDRGGSRPFQLRYMRYWIEKGHERVGEPLAPADLLALDRLDEALDLPEARITFRLGPGESLWVDNRRLAHGRLAYDRVPPGGRRLWRLWLARRGG